MRTGYAERRAHAMVSREVIVHDAIEPCPYLEGRSARLPHRWQRMALSPTEVDEALARGDRRAGPMLYRPTCPSCQACEALRLPVDALVHSRSQRRAWKKNQDLRVEVGGATCSEARLALFNRHKMERGLARRETPMTAEGYTSWFLRSCCPTIEMRYLLGDKLIGVGILDVGARDLSSVYFYFDPDHEDRSLGTFSVLFECAWLRGRGGRYHYLGLYAEGSRHIEYKARFYPHERLVGGVWRRVDGPEAPPLP